jgi:hypothetical protein
MKIRIFISTTVWGVGKREAGPGVENLNSDQIIQRNVKNM